MSLDSVLRYDSLAGARRKLEGMGATHLLRSVYGGYDGSSLPSQRQAYLDGVFSAQLREPPGGLYDAAEIGTYVAGLCHAIWVEEHAGLPWSLRDYDAEAICFLLDRWVDTNGWTSDGQGTDGCWGTIYGGPPLEQEAIADEWHKAFPLSFYLIGRNRNPLEAAQRFVTWIMPNFFHAYGHPVEDWGWGTYGCANRSVIPLKRYFDERVVGCHATAKILAAMLRSVNIPAIEVHYAGHGVCWAPTLARLVHGDYMADYAILEDNATLLMTQPELERWLFHTDGYTSFEDEIEKTDVHTGVALRRRGRSLYVAHTPSDSEDMTRMPPLQQISTPGFYAGLQARLPQFGIHEVGNEHYSQPVPILGLDELSAYGLALSIDRDGDGYVVITLQNRGITRLPADEGVLLIEIDGVLRGGYNLPRLDPGFVDRGGRTVVRTNFQIGPGEHGIVRATVTRLPASSQSIEVTRHLGKPLEPIPPDVVIIP